MRNGKSGIDSGCGRVAIFLISKKVTSCLTGLGLVIHFPVNVFKNRLWGGVRAVERKLGGNCGLFLDRFVEFVDLVFCDHPLFNQAFPPKPDRIMVRFVALDLFRATVFFGICVGDRMPVVAVGIDFEDGRQRFFIGALHGD